MARRDALGPPEPRPEGPKERWQPLNPLEREEIICSGLHRLPESATLFDWSAMGSIIMGSMGFAVMGH